MWPAQNAPLVLTWTRFLDCYLNTPSIRLDSCQQHNDSVSTGLRRPDVESLAAEAPNSFKEKVEGSRWGTCAAGVAAIHSRGDNRPIVVLAVSCCVDTC